MEIRLYTAADYAEWLRLRGALWPHHEPGGSGHRLAGFAEVGARSFADGCVTSPVAYLEGWYVDPDVRRAGVGATLVRAAVAWARARGFTELASDALLENGQSQRAHEALGFREVERSVKYRLDLGADGGAPVV